MNADQILAELQALAEKSQSLIEPVHCLLSESLPIPQDYQHRADCKGVQMQVKCIGCFKGWIAEQKREKEKITTQLKSALERVTVLENEKVIREAEYLSLILPARNLANIAQMAVEILSKKNGDGEFDLFTKKLQDTIDSTYALVATEETSSAESHYEENKLSTPESQTAFETNQGEEVQEENNSEEPKILDKTNVRKNRNSKRGSEANKFD